MTETSNENKNVEKKGIKKRVSTIAFFILCGLVGYFGSSILLTPFLEGVKDQISLSQFQKILIIPGALIMMWFAIAIHELGHLLTGFAQKFKFLLYVVGPLWVSRSRQNIEVKWNPYPALWGGLAATIPADFKAEGLKNKMIKIVWGGPLASLGLMILGLLALLVWGIPKSSWLQWLYLMLGFLSVGSGLIFLLTLIPFESGGFKSDGARIRNLSSKGPKADREEALLYLTAAMYGGIRPGEWEPKWLQAISTVSDGSAQDIAAYQMQFYHNLDLKHFDKAAPWLSKLKEQLHNYPQAFIKYVLMDVYWFESYVNKNPEESSRIWNRLEKKLNHKEKSMTYFRVMAARALEQEHFEEALQLLVSAQQAKSSLFSTPGVDKMEVDLIADMQIAIKERAA